MIVVTGIFDVAEEERESFLESKGPQASRTLDETGCREYAYSADGARPGRVRLIELWDSMDDLKAHLAGLRASPPPPSPVDVLSSEFNVFEASPTRAPWA